MSEDPPRVGVLVRPDRVEEGLRMASALPLADSVVEVILTGTSLPATDAVATHLESLADFDATVLATFEDPRVDRLQAAELAARLGGYEHVITF